MWWLVRRPGFDVTKWKAKCRCVLCVCVCVSTMCLHARTLPRFLRCKHPHTSHTADYARRCRHKGCGCGQFSSDFACVVCDKHWEDVSAVQ